MVIEDSVIDFTIDAYINKVTPEKCDFMRLLHDAPIQCTEIDSASEGMVRTEPAISTPKNHMRSLYEESCTSLTSSENENAPHVSIETHELNESGEQLQLNVASNLNECKLRS